MSSLRLSLPTRRLAVLAALAGALAVYATPALAASGISWSKFSKSPLTRMEAQGATVGGRLYVFGGYTSSNWHPTREVDAFNPVTNTWTKVADMPIGRSHQGIAVDGASIYLAGGYPEKTPTRGQSFSSDRVWKFDTTSASFQELPRLPEARGSGALAIVDRQLHFFGGADPHRQDSGSHWVLNLQGGTAWTAADPLPTPRTHMCGVSLEGKIYAVGGQQRQDANAKEKGENEVWEPATGAWRAAAPLPDARSHIACFVLDGEMVVAGGLLTPSQATPLVSDYAPGTNVWRALTPLPKQRVAGVADVVEGTVVFTTGSLQANTWKGVPTP